MSRVGIVTDSTNCLPPELIEEYDIRVGPVTLSINGGTYRDQIDITPTEFYRMFPDLEELPTTSGVMPVDFVNHFEDLARITDSIVFIVLSKDLSVTWQSAVQARELFIKEHPDVRVEIVDTRTAAGAVGMIALEAARAAGAGKTLDEVVKVVKDVMPRVNFVATLDTLKYLIKGGRAPNAASVVNVMHLKPIIGLLGSPGKVKSLGMAAGKRKSLSRLVDLVKKYADPRRPLHIMVHHSGHPAEGEELKEMVISRLDCAEVYLTEITPVMTCHTGPMTGLTVYSE